MRIKLAIAALMVLMIAGTSIVGAHPSDNRACDTCHAYPPKLLNISTNVTSVTVNTGESFAVGISWSGGANDGQTPTAVKWPSVMNNSLFNPNPVLPVNGVKPNGTTASVLTAPATAGSYVVRVYAADGTWSGIPTKETNYTDINVTVQNVTVPPPAVNNSSISGMKFNDTNSNGVKDTGELGLAGWTIGLIMPNGSVVNTTTDANGNYTFSGLASGIYTVKEILQTNWTQTAPKPIPPGTYTVNLASGQNVTGRDFGNFMNVTANVTPTVTVTVTATATVSPTATVTGTPEKTPGVTKTPKPTKTPKVTHTPEVTHTPGGPPTAVPEFPTLVLPVAAVMGLMMLLLYRRRE